MPRNRRSGTIRGSFRLSVLVAIAVLDCTSDPEAPTPTPGREPTATADPSEVVLRWSREGGIAGFCDGLLLTAGHRATLGDCADPPMTDPTSDLASDAAIREFGAWRREFDSFEVEWSDGPDMADGLTVRLSFIGRGTRVADEDTQREIADFAARLFAEIAAEQPRAGEPAKPVS